MTPLTNEQQKPYENANICHICEEKFEDKHAQDKKTSYKLQLINSGRFMVRSVPNLVSNLAEEIRKIKCRYGYNDKKI